MKVENKTWGYMSNWWEVHEVNEVSLLKVVVWRVKYKTSLK